MKLRQGIFASLLVVLALMTTPVIGATAPQAEDEGGIEQKIQRVARGTEYLLTGKVVFASAKDMPRDRLVVIANVRYGDTRHTVETRETRRTANEIFFTTVWFDIISMSGAEEPGRTAGIWIIPKLMPDVKTELSGIEIRSRAVK